MKGIIDAMQKGVYAGYPIVDIKVKLVDGAFHEVDSSERAFFTCASIAFKELFRKGGPELLEPVMSVNVITSGDYLGGVNGDLSSRRGRIEGMEQKGVNQEVTAMVPLGNMFGYATNLRTLTRGTASFSMTFDHYEAVPFAMAEEIIADKKKANEKKKS